MNNKPKVAYLSWLGSNYGSALQGTALYTSIKKFGYDCKIIGASKFHKWKKPDVSLKTKNPKKYDHDLMSYNFTVFMEQFLEFADKLDDIRPDGLLSPAQIEECAQYSAFVCGSDQVWKPYTFWFTAKQYLTFADSERTIGYAPSVGWKEIPPEAEGNVPQWKTWLTHVKYLSARDVPSAKLLSQVTGRDVATVIDPTLLLTPDEWLGILPPPQYAQEISEVLNSGKPYLLAYLLDTSPERENIVVSLSRKLGLEVIWLTGRSNTGPVQRNCAETDPSGFVHLIAGSSFLVADGFHGCCFAINFSKPFIFIASKAGPGNDSRIEDLHERMGVPGRIVSSLSDLEQKELKLDFTKTAQLLSDGRKESLKFLQKALKGSVAKSLGNGEVVAVSGTATLQKITLDTTKISFDMEHWRTAECDDSSNVAFSTVSFQEEQGHFLTIKLSDALTANKKYHFSGKILIESDSDVVCIHIGNETSEHPDIINQITDFKSGDWQEVSFDFSPKMMKANCLMFGASQFSGREGRLELAQVVISEVKKTSADIANKEEEAAKSLYNAKALKSTNKNDDFYNFDSSLKFVFDPVIWDCHVILGHTTLIPYDINPLPRNYAFCLFDKLMLRDKKLIKGKKYNLSIDVKYHTSSALINLHLYSKKINKLQVIHTIRVSQIQMNKWNTVNLVFQPNDDHYDSLMVGAVQISGENRFISFKNLCISDV